MRPHTRLTFHDFFTGLIGAWEEKRPGGRLPVRAELSRPLETVLPEILRDADGLGLELDLRFRCDMAGESQTIEDAKHFAWMRSLLERRSPSPNLHYYHTTPLALSVFHTFPERQRDLFRRALILLWKEMRK